MRRKKTEVPETVPSNQQPTSTNEGVIDLDAETKTTAAVEAVDTPAQAPVRPKRKYTRKPKAAEPSDYQQRVIAELEDLNFKRDELSAFLSSLPSAAEIERLSNQLITMTQYASILKDRIDNFGKQA